MNGPLRNVLVTNVTSNDFLIEGLCGGIEPVLPAERVGGVGDDGVAGARPEVLQAEGGQGARDVVGEQAEAAAEAAAAEAAAAPTSLLLLLLVDLQMEAGRVPAVEPRLARQEELL